MVIRFANPKGIDFPYLLSMLHDSFMSRPNIIVCPGGKMELAMQLIFTPMILKLMDVRRRALGAAARARAGRGLATAALVPLSVGGLLQLLVFFLGLLHRLGLESSAYRLSHTNAPQPASSAAVPYKMAAAPGKAPGSSCTPLKVATSPSMASATISTTRNRDRNRRTRVAADMSPADDLLLGDGLGDLQGDDGGGEVAERFDDFLCSPLHQPFGESGPCLVGCHDDQQQRTAAATPPWRHE